MSTIKNGQILLCCKFNKIIKGPRTSSQSPALSQKRVRNVCHIVRQHFTKFNFDSAQYPKEIQRKCNFHYLEMPMMTSHILKSVDFTKIQKSIYLKNKALSREQKIH